MECKHCGEPIGSPDTAYGDERKAWQSGQCKECWAETAKGKLGPPPSGQQSEGRIVRKPETMGG